MEESTLGSAIVEAVCYQRMLNVWCGEFHDSFWDKRIAESKWIIIGARNDILVDITIVKPIVCHCVFNIFFYSIQNGVNSTMCSALLFCYNKIQRMMSPHSAALFMCGWAPLKAMHIASITGGLSVRQKSTAARAILIIISMPSS